MSSTSAIFNPDFTMHSTTTHHHPHHGFLSPKLTLDMSFNRNPTGRFASDIDPLDSPHAHSTQAPMPTFADLRTEIQGLDALLDAWSFPLRTDFARGIIWGPFRHCRGNSYAAVGSPEAVLELSRSYDVHAMCPARPQPTAPHHQRIFPILRSQPTPSSLSSSSSSSSSASSTSTPHSTPPSSRSASSSSSSSSSKKRPRTPSPAGLPSPRPSRAVARKMIRQTHLHAASKPSPPSHKKAKFFSLEIPLSPYQDLPPAPAPAPLIVHPRKLRLCPSSQLKYGTHNL